MCVVSSKNTSLQIESIEIVDELIQLQENENIRQMDRDTLRMVYNDYPSDNETEDEIGDDTQDTEDGRLNKITS